MKKMMKKLVTAIVSASLLVSAAAPAYAAEQATVFVNFNCAGQVTGQTVPVGSNVVAPAAPMCAGFTFCGFDKSLRNVTANTTYTAIYVSNDLGLAAIAAKKASLPTPAITATTVANPNLVAAAPAAVPAAQAVTVTTPATTASTTASTTTTTATDAQAQQAAAQQAALAQLLAQIQAAAKATEAQAAAQKAQTSVAQAAEAAAAQTLAAAQAVEAQQAAAQTAPAAVAPVAAGVPSWVVGLEGVDAAGAANAYNYLKNTKGLDDGTIQANWGSLMHHYAGHGVAGW